MAPTITQQLLGGRPGATVIDLSNGWPQQQQPDWARITAALIRIDDSLASIAESLERLADRLGTPLPPTEPGPEEIRQAEQRYRQWAG